MTRKEHLEYCAVCLNRSFDPKYGVTCNLTGKIADFENNCENFKEDSNEVASNQRSKEALKEEETKPLKSGRSVLFLLGAAYILIGIYQGVEMLNHNIIFGIINWIIAACFIGFGILSFRKPFLAFILGLTLYVLLILLLALIEPSTLISGLLWKVFVILYLAFAINTSKKEKSVVKSKLKGDDLLDY